MRPVDDPYSLTPDERLAEVAGILAAGILRLHTRAALYENGAESAKIPDIPAESSSPRLDVSGETVLSVHNG